VNWHSGDEIKISSDFMTLRDAMDRLFDDAFTRPFSLVRNGGATWSSLPIDLYQTTSLFG
jgi:hypothetical protein